MKKSGEQNKISERNGKRYEQRSARKHVRKREVEIRSNAVIKELNEESVEVKERKLDRKLN